MWQYHVAEARTERGDNREGKLRRPIHPLGGGGGIAMDGSATVPKTHPIHLGPNDNNYYFKDADTSGPSLAGLLDFPNTRELRKWLESRAVQDLWKQYNDFRMRGFEGVEIGVYGAMRERGPYQGIGAVHLLRTDNVKWEGISARTRPLLVTLWYARRLVMTNPEVFIKFIGFPEGTENIARGVRCLRLMWDRKVKNLSVAPSKNQPAFSVPRYLDPANPSYRRPDGSRHIVEETHSPVSTDGPTPLKQRQADNQLTDELLLEICCWHRMYAA
ncbi:hypothetical protein GP486_002072 [Trichoglossum hirsutum]|uniref:Uncharacterized protein n=1 Tax=Trichoglossum hirsutum TaxID=265104 RepID=A0A9P8LFX4_9PEZI|nr:hypothetical protein GP486_002072 [Trichoglossum hirsutum]